MPLKSEEFSGYATPFVPTDLYFRNSYLLRLNASCVIRYLTDTGLPYLTLNTNIKGALFYRELNPISN